MTGWGGGLFRRLKVAAKRHERSTKAASNIQRIVRGRNAKRRVQVIKDEKETEAAALHIQRVARGRLGRQKSQNRRDHHTAQNDAAMQVQRIIRGRQSRSEVRLLKEVRASQQKKLKMRKEYAGLNKPLRSPYRAALSKQAKSERRRRRKEREILLGYSGSSTLLHISSPGGTSASAPVLVGGVFATGSKDRIPLISIDSSVDDEADASIRAMQEEVRAELALETRDLASQAASKSAVAAAPETLTAGGDDSHAPVLALAELESQEDQRISDMRESILFIKEKFSALKQISELDASTALQGGWTEEALEEELVKLKAELLLERRKLKQVLELQTPKNIKGRQAATRKRASRRAPHPRRSERGDFADEVANRLAHLCKQLDRHCKAHEREERERRFGRPSPMTQYSPLIPSRLKPVQYASHMLKPLFRGDLSPEGRKRQQRRARSSVTGGMRLA